MIPPPSGYTHKLLIIFVYMKKGEYFKIETVEELKKAYDMFEDEWFYSLEIEIKIFNSNKGYRYVRYDYDGIYLGYDKIHELTEIPSPVRKINNLNKLI